MARKFAQLQQIHNDRRITQEDDYEFLYHLQNGLLLALRERGSLDTKQYRHAEEQLRHQRQKQMKKESL